MKKHLVVFGLLLALGATAAAADTRQHYATASTKKEAKLLATAEARAIARTSALCFRPARQVGLCEMFESGFRCRADSSANARTCRGAGWVTDFSLKASSMARADQRWESDSWPSNPWGVRTALSENTSHLYGRTVPGSAGPPSPPPVPN